MVMVLTQPVCRPKYMLEKQITRPTARPTRMPRAVRDWPGMRRGCFLGGTERVVLAGFSWEGGMVGGVDVDGGGEEDGAVVVVAGGEAGFGFWRGIAEGARGVLDGRMVKQKGGIMLLSAT